MGPSGYFSLLVVTLMGLLSVAAAAYAVRFGWHPWGRDGKGRVTRAEQPGRFWLCVLAWLLWAALCGGVVVGLWTGEMVTRGDRIWRSGPPS
ncbi:MAG: hypothetical protein HXX10_27855 [Rhodoplanes sp.]|uniref:hypothetical protein n=1 Tax=Rhodoplanes sp. TaxID=1968906 RepID=UPI00180D223D|nr:hypothetical protein [Rhodoplanes sp.]NVO17854.1 hypothetical protein [Rhodoplanes sp.]